MEEAEAEGAQTPPPQAKEDEPAGDDAVSASPSVKVAAARTCTSLSLETAFITLPPHCAWCMAAWGRDRSAVRGGLAHKEARNAGCWE